VGRAKHATQRAFTLIELMVVVSIIALSASIAFTAINPNQFSNAANDFSEEIAAQLLLARDRAIDEQVQVQVDITTTTVGTRYLDEHELDNTWDQEIWLRQIAREDFGGAKLTDEICILSVSPLLYAPSQPGTATIPEAACPPSTANDTPFATINFQPDGTYLIQTSNNLDFTEVGWIVVVLPSTTSLSSSRPV
jgi:prepilin-type N-terminal cleavage/methylation domain-containing protein